VQAKEKTMKESNAGFSNALLTNIPEVDLGIEYVSSLVPFY
jgi:hypothetical protein